MNYCSDFSKNLSVGIHRRTYNTNFLKIPYRFLKELHVDFFQISLEGSDKKLLNIHKIIPSRLCLGTFSKILSRIFSRMFGSRILFLALLIHFDRVYILNLLSSYFALIRVVLKCFLIANFQIIRPRKKLMPKCIMKPYKFGLDSHFFTNFM